MLGAKCMFFDVNKYSKQGFCIVRDVWLAAAAMLSGSQVLDQADGVNRMAKASATPP